MNNLFNNKDINLSLIGIPILLSISICLYVFSDVTQSIKVLKSIYENAALQLENVFEFGGFLIFVFLVLISLMPTASKKITIADRPKFNNIAWCGMMFAAGMGASILFLSPLEWAHTYNASPFLLESSDPLLSKYSQSYPLFHWGFIGWAIFALPAAAFAFGLLKKSDMPLTISALLIKGSTPIERITKALVDMICILAILATYFYVQISLASPLRKMISQVRELELNKSLQLNRSDEIGQIADAIDIFTKRIRCICSSPTRIFPLSFCWQTIEISSHCRKPLAKFLSSQLCH